MGFKVSKVHAISLSLSLSLPLPLSLPLIPPSLSLPPSLPLPVFLRFTLRSHLLLQQHGCQLAAMLPIMIVIVSSPLELLESPH